MTDWEYVDFKPAPPGWRVIYLLDDNDPEGHVFVADIAGWLVQRNVQSSKEIRLVAADHDEFGELTNVNAASNFWRVIGPGHEVPTPEEAQAERASRAR